MWTAEWISTTQDLVHDMFDESYAFQHQPVNVLDDISIDEPEVVRLSSFLL